MTISHLVRTRRISVGHPTVHLAVPVLQLHRPRCPRCPAFPASFPTGNAAVATLLGTRAPRTNTRALARGNGTPYGAHHTSTQTVPRSHHSTVTFVLVGQDDSSSSEATAGDLGSSTVDLARLSISSVGHYLPAAAVTGACALHWMPFASAVSAARALLGASHEDLRLRANQLSHELSGAFFDRQAAAAAARPFAAVCGGATARFPEDGLYVCADLPPLGPALQDVQRALLQVAVKDASHVMRSAYAGDGRGPAVFDRNKFELVFALKRVDVD